MPLTVECDVVVREDGSRSIGPYRRVAHTVRMRGWPQEQIWRDEEGGDIRVEPERVGRPYAVTCFDFDGTLVETEGPGRFFFARRGKLMRRSGIDGSDCELDALQQRVWRWEGDTATSFAAMQERMQRGLDRYGRPVIDVGGQWSTFLAADPVWLAGEAERIGQQLLEQHPEAVFHLAPIAPGVDDFLKAVPTHVPLGIISGSCTATTVTPILEAHARVRNPFLRDRVGSLIVGAEDITGLHKPESAFYQEALFVLARKMRAAGAIPGGYVEIGDVVLIGDTVGDTGLDVAKSRRHSVVLVDVGDREPPGPLCHVAVDFSSLLDAANRPLHTISSPVLQRLARTLARS